MDGDRIGTVHTGPEMGGATKVNKSVTKDVTTIRLQSRDAVRNIGLHLV